MRTQAEDRNLYAVVREAVANTQRRLKSKPEAPSLKELSRASNAVLECWRHTEIYISAAIDDDIEGFLLEHNAVTDMLGDTQTTFGRCDGCFSKVAGTTRPDSEGLAYHSAHHALLAEVISAVQLTGFAVCGESLFDGGEHRTTESLMREHWQTIRESFCSASTLDGSNLELQCEIELTKAIELRRIPDAKRSEELSLQEAAKKFGQKGSKAGAKWLRACMDDGTIQFEEITRQRFVFDKTKFVSE